MPIPAASSRPGPVPFPATNSNRRATATRSPPLPRRLCLGPTSPGRWPRRPARRGPPRRLRTQRPSPPPDRPPVPLNHERKSVAHRLRDDARRARSGTRPERPHRVGRAFRPPFRSTAPAPRQHPRSTRRVSPRSVPCRRTGNRNRRARRSGRPLPPRSGRLLALFHGGGTRRCRRRPGDRATAGRPQGGHREPHLRATCPRRDAPAGSPEVNLHGSVGASG